MTLSLTVARRSSSVGSGRAKVTRDVVEASVELARGAPVVLVGRDAAALGDAVSASADRDSRERLLAVVVGDPDDPAVMLAAQEMAGELWQWARGERAGEGAGGTGDTVGTGP